MSRTTINRLIINSPYEEPQRHWRYDREARAFELVASRRPASSVIPIPNPFVLFAFLCGSQPNGHRSAMTLPR